MRTESYVCWPGREANKTFLAWCLTTVCLKLTTDGINTELVPPTIKYKHRFLCLQIYSYGYEIGGKHKEIEFGEVV